MGVIQRLEAAALIHPLRTGRGRTRRPTVGFLTDSLTESYQLSLFRGAARSARDRQVNLIAFSAGVPGSSHPSRSLVGQQTVDVLVVTASTMAYEIGIEGIAEYCRSLGDLPACFIGARAERVSAVLADNHSGMEQVVRHMVRVHGRKQFAFISGPRGHSEAEERLRACQKVLRESGLELSESCIEFGDFMRHSGARAMARILDRGNRPDAVVAACDMMALGALETLTERGIAIPQDIAVVGFDDVEEACFSVPPLTSMRQPLGELGREALRLALAALEGQAPETVTLNLRLMLRPSCGCKGEASGLSVGRTSLLGTWEVEFARRRSVIVAELSRASQAALGQVSPTWREKLLHALIDDLRADTESAFVDALQPELQRSRASGGNLGAWHDVLSVLRDESRQCLGDDVELLGRLEDRLHAARRLVATEMQNAQAWRRMQVEHWMRALRESSVSFGATRTVDNLLPAIVEHLDRLGFRSAYLALHDDDAQTSRLLLGYDRSLPLKTVTTAPIFTTLQLTPPGYQSTDILVWIALPLQILEEQCGFLLLDYGPGEGILWETLRQQIAVALSFCSLLAACG